MGLMRNVFWCIQQPHIGFEIRPYFTSWIFALHWNYMITNNVTTVGDIKVLISLRYFKSLKICVNLRPEHNRTLSKNEDISVSIDILNVIYSLRDIFLTWYIFNVIYSKRDVWFILYVIYSLRDIFFPWYILDVIYS